MARPKASRPNFASRNQTDPTLPTSPQGPWKLRKRNGLLVLELEAFGRLRWLVYGFSTRAGGVSTLHGQSLLNLSYTDWDLNQRVEENRFRLQRALDASEFALLPLRQIHSDLIELFTAPAARTPHGDASLTSRPGLLLAIQTADCVPLLVVDPKRRAVAAVHAGWRGTLARIAEKTVGRMQLHFGSKPRDLLAALGPSIGPCCYEVAAEFVTQFSSQFADGASYFDSARTGEEPNPLEWLSQMPPGHRPPPKTVHLDLRKANRSQLLAAGLAERNLFISDLCTACHTDLFFSYRKEGPRSGRLMALVGIRRHQ